MRKKSRKCIGFSCHVVFIELFHSNSRWYSAIVLISFEKSFANISIDRSYIIVKYSAVKSNEVVRWYFPSLPTVSQKLENCRSNIVSSYSTSISMAPDGIANISMEIEWNSIKCIFPMSAFSSLASRNIPVSWQLRSKIEQYQKSTIEFISTFIFIFIFMPNRFLRFSMEMI